ncbi:unnamed protein product [Clonostachys rhizophaga]|uniref:Tyrosinase copper-binding domain-containing protein n=1 Tax=Clonostachys rhizophaga TaxID=160324 RepID=A0A9N9VL20_9HYPO|nr:unnamed protein product [Clonostachys rhizophaga]
MRASSLLAVALISLALAQPHVKFREEGSEEQQIAKLIEEIKADVLQSLDESVETMRKRGEQASCNARNIVFRREYGSLSKQERLGYIEAVKCLQKLPARTPQSEAAGAKSRFDDFVVVHIQPTLDIHFSGVFQPWHRWFLHRYEKALRDECGYMGYQPYWDWAKSHTATEKSPVFNGDSYSLGGNGDSIPHQGPVIVPPARLGGGSIQLPAGVGGGFVTTGPFANVTINLGPTEQLEGKNILPSVSEDPELSRPSMFPCKPSNATHEETAVSESVVSNCKSPPASSVSSSSVSTATDGGFGGGSLFDVPPPPKLDGNEKEKTCPYCYLVLPAKTFSTVKRWERHLVEDLQPYICLFANCSLPGKTYSSFKAWQRHLSQPHYRSWHCSLHPKDGSSDGADDEALTFDSLLKFKTHLRIFHLDLDPSSVEDSFRHGHQLAALPQWCFVCFEALPQTASLLKHMANHFKSMSCWRCLGATTSLKRKR